MPFGRSDHPHHVVRIALAVAVAGAAIAATAVVRAALDAPATVPAGSVAARQPSTLVDGACDLGTVEALATRHPDVRQFVVVATSDFASNEASVEVAVRTGGRWACQRDPMFSRIGRNGSRPLLERRSGDGTTPAGVFPLGEVTAWDGQTFQFFGNDPDPGVRGGYTYRDVRPQDCWGATPNAPRYQHVVAAPGCRLPDEWLPSYVGSYAHAAIIGANLDPISGDEPGETPYAAAIFLHRHSYAADGSTRPVSGCVTLALDDLAATIRLLDPALDPHFAIGPRDWLRDDA